MSSNNKYTTPNYKYSGFKTASNSKTLNVSEKNKIKARKKIFPDEFKENKNNYASITNINTLSEKKSKNFKTPGKLNLAKNLQEIESKKTNESLKLALQKIKKKSTVFTPIVKEIINKRSVNNKSSESSEIENIILSPAQRKVYNHVISGQNVFFTGCAGTGKSVLIKELCKELKKTDKKVYITASTGIAAININGRTLHSWAGIGHGKAPLNSLIKTIKLRNATRLRWETTDILIIDEISMISGQVFDKLEAISRRIRGDKSPFGGIQLVISGDFLQLPPVNAINLAFEGTSWGKCIPPTCIFELTEVYRQSDEQFINMLSELRCGVLSPKSEYLLSNTSRNNSNNDSVLIYAHRNPVNRTNLLKLQSLKTPPHTYIAEDVSNGYPGKYLESLFINNCPLQKKVTLKSGAKVMINKNIDQKLVNGLGGVIKGFQKFEVTKNIYQKNKSYGTQNGKIIKFELFPIVYFPSLKKSYIIDRVSWESYNEDGSIRAKRTQIPLQLFWSLTIHKCQGLTLDSGTMNLGSVWEPGHFYVAVSRIRNLNGLKLIGRFNKSCVKANPKVITWMKNQGLLQKQTPAEVKKVKKLIQKEVESNVDIISTPLIPVNKSESPLKFLQKKIIDNRKRRRGI